MGSMVNSLSLSVSSDAHGKSQKGADRYSGRRRIMSNSDRELLPVVAFFFLACLVGSSEMFRMVGFALSLPSILDRYYQLQSSSIEAEDGNKGQMMVYQ